MEDIFCMEETPCDLTKPRIAPYRNTWTRLRYTVCWCNLKLVQQKDLQSYQTRSHAVVLYNTPPAVCIESGMYEKLRMSSTSATGLYSNRTRNTVNKISKTKTQDHLGNHQAIRNVMGKLVTTPWITEYLEYLFVLSSSRIQHARTKSRG